MKCAQMSKNVIRELDLLIITHVKIKLKIPKIIVKILFMAFMKVKVSFVVMILPLKGSLRKVC